MITYKFTDKNSDQGLSYLTLSIHRLLIYVVAVCKSYFPERYIYFFFKTDQFIPQHYTTVYEAGNFRSIFFKILLEFFVYEKVF